MELLAKYYQQVLETIDVFTIHFMQTIPRKNKKIKASQALCIQIPPVKYSSVCQTRKYLDTGKQPSVPFIQQTLKGKTSAKLRLIASEIFKKSFTT